MPEASQLRAQPIHVALAKSDMKAADVAADTLIQQLGAQGRSCVGELPWALYTAVAVS